MASDFDRCRFALFSSSLGGRNEGSSRVARGGGIGRAVGLGLCAGTTARLIYAKLQGHQAARHDADRGLPSSRRRWGQLTALNVARCVGDIGNNNGQLQCNGGQPATPTPPRPRQGAAPVYPGPGYFPSPGTGYPPPGHGPDYRWSEAQAFREHCERLRSAEHEIRDRLAYTPYGEEREQLQYRLSQIHQEREPCRRGRP